MLRCVILMILVLNLNVARADYYGEREGYAVWFTNPVMVSGVRLTQMRLNHQSCKLNPVTVVLPKSIFHVHWSDFNLPFHQGVNGSYFYPGSYAGPNGAFTLKIPYSVSGVDQKGNVCTMPALTEGSAIHAVWYAA